MNSRLDVTAQIQINDRLAEIRGRTLDAVESQIGNGPNWQTVRRQLLRLFGDLERLIAETFEGR